MAGAARNPHHFFGEGGAIDWLSTIYLGTAALLAWAAWLTGDRKERGAWFWLVSAAGLAFLSVSCWLLRLLWWLFDGAVVAVACCAACGVRFVVVFKFAF